MSGPRAVNEPYILVGNGLSAQVLAHRFEELNIPFTIIGNSELSNSSRVAAGIWNPVVFKRMTKSWMAETLIDELLRFYSDCETRMKQRFLIRRTIIKPFFEEQEKQLWKKKSADELKPFIQSSIHSGSSDELRNLQVSNGYGLVEQSGNLQTADFLDAGNRYFADRIRHETFDYSQIKMFEHNLSYKSLPVKGIVFCEGHLVSRNPFFSWIPLKPAKGELLHILAPDLQLKNAIYNRNGFLMHQGESRYICGATYNWADLTDRRSEQGLQELKEKVKKMISCNYNVVSHLAGVRPSSIDRRPILGVHPKHKNLFVFNGLGAKGVMLAPYFAGKFVLFLKEWKPLPAEVDLKRFYHLYAD
jgi:glycine oxidase